MQDLRQMEQIYLVSLDIFANSPEYLSAIVVHDYLCDLEEYKKADEYLKEMMSELNVAKWKSIYFTIVVSFIIN